MEKKDCVFEDQSFCSKLKESYKKHLENSKGKEISFIDLAFDNQDFLKKISPIKKLSKSDLEWVKNEVFGPSFYDCLGVFIWTIINKEEERSQTYISPVYFDKEKDSTGKMCWLIVSFGLDREI